MRAIVTVIGKDQVGIIAMVSTLLCEQNVNILDITQTVMQDNFTMTMLVDVSQATISFADLSAKLSQAGKMRELQIQIQREDIFNAMHRV